MACSARLGKEPEMIFDPDYQTIFFLFIAVGGFLRLCYLANRPVKYKRVKSRYWKDWR